MIQHTSIIKITSLDRLGTVPPHMLNSVRFVRITSMRALVGVSSAHTARKVVAEAARMRSRSASHAKNAP